MREDNIQFGTLYEQTGQILELCGFACLPTRFMAYWFYDGALQKFDCPFSLHRNLQRITPGEPRNHRIDLKCAPTDG